jgi:hypothetical protein
MLVLAHEPDGLLIAALALPDAGLDSGWQNPS